MRKTNWHIFLCLLATAVAVIPSLVLSADPPDPKWSLDGCRKGYTFCSNVTTMESWTSGEKKIYFFLDVIANTKKFDDANLTVWYVGENFDEFWAEDLLKHNPVNVVRFYPRGGDYAYPQIKCDENYYNPQHHCAPSISCAEQIAKSGVNLQHYSIAETAADLAWVVRKFGGQHMRNVIVAEGLGTFVVQEMLRAKGKMENVWVIMAGFTHPEYFDAFSSLYSGYDAAMQRVLTYCERESSMECLSRVGATEGLWDRIINVLTAAETNMLKCNSLLSWGVRAEGMHREYRAVLAQMLKHPGQLVIPIQRALQQLIPSFIYRLQRCNERDVAALNKLYSYIKRGVQGECPVVIPQQYNWLVNDLMKSIPSDPTQVMRDASGLRQIMPNITTLQSFYDFYEAFPKYKVNKNSITSTDVPMMLLFSDVDSIFPWGAAGLAAVLYKSAERRFLPFQSGLPVSTTASDCILKNIENIYKGKGWLDAAHCSLTSDFALDLIGIDATSYYGRKDAWEFTVPNFPEIISNTTSTTPPPAPSPEIPGECSNKGVIVLAVLFVITLLALLGMFVMQWKKTTYYRVSDDFYTNLHH